MKTAAQLIVGVLLAASATFGSEACSSTSPDPAATSGGEDGGPRADPDGAQKPDTPGAGANCMGLAATCGGSKDCCASNLVAGGTFKRSVSVRAFAAPVKSSTMMTSPPVMQTTSVGQRES